MGGGHYVAYARNPNGHWYYYNDSACKQTIEEKLTKENAYMLVYTACGLGQSAQMWYTLRGGELLQGVACVEISLLKPASGLHRSLQVPSRDR